MQKMKDGDRIRPCPENPFYWQYKGKAIVAIGGSREDNLFQIPDIEEHLDLLSSVGGNYVRCTMSSRDEGDVWPFERDSDGLYDLASPGREYWERFSRFLSLTAERDIIVQVELWATFDFYREPWLENPFNPKNNRNYTEEESGLHTVVNSHPTKTENPFFWSVPGERDNRTLVEYQRKFVDTLLSYSLDYGHVLYCMDNETSVTPRWGEYWSEYIKSRAAERGATIQTSEMWDHWDLSHEQHANTFDHPETYSFVDISQNNHQKGREHWDNAQEQRGRVAISGIVRPLTNVKIYGADGGKFGDTRDGRERFWRNIIGGMASARFHRPGSGLGLSSSARANIRSARDLVEKIDIVRCNPAMPLLSGCKGNTAYCTADPGRVYAVYFPAGGEALLDCSEAAGKVFVERLDIESSRWTAEGTKTSNSVNLAPPDNSPCVFVVTSKE